MARVFLGSPSPLNFWRTNLFIPDMFFLVIVLSCGAVAAPPGVYELPLDAEAKHKMYWTLDRQEGIINIEVRAAMPAGHWFALGFSDRGERFNADLCIFLMDISGRARIVDGWTDDMCLLHLENEQDCMDLRHSTTIGNITRFSFSRKLDTCHLNDYVIEEGTTHIVYATDSGRLEGRSLCSVVGGFTRTQLLKPAIANVPHGESWHLSVTANGVHVPSDETTYWCHVIKLPSKLSEKHHIIQFEAVIQPGNEGLVHHMELFHCETDRSEEIPLYRGHCDRKPKPVEVCKKVIAAWAMGATPFSYPEEAGLPVGGPEFGTYAMLEIHYNNPDRKSDWVDNSGLRVYLTRRLRTNDAAVIELGLEYIDKMAIPPGQAAFPLPGYCVPQCTSVALPEKGILVFASQLHTHLTGVKIVTRHFRRGLELPLLNGDPHYSTHFQEIRILPRQIRVLPGDSLVTTCWYDTRTRTNITLGGFAISEEMCVNYIYYYPKTELEVCKSSISDRSLGDYFDTLRKFENQKTSSDFPISESYRNIEWNPLRTKVLAKLYMDAPIYMQCNKSSGERYPGDWSSIHTTPITTPVPVAPRRCPPILRRSFYMK